MSKCILLLWTKDKAAEAWVEALTRGGYRAGLHDRDGIRMSQVRKARPDGILLDTRPPLERAIRWCAVLRRDAQLADIPILAVAAGRTKTEIRRVVKAGADGGLPRSLSPARLMARIRTCMKQAPLAPEEGDIRVGALTVSQKRVQVYCGDRVIPGLSLMEFRALRTLAENRGRTITRGQILAATHEEHTDATERSVDVLIVGLRRKLRARSAMIETIHGVGYRLAPDAECPAGPETRSPR